MTPPEIIFTLARGQNVFFADLAHALVFELERLGAEARVASGEFPTAREGAVNVILPPHEFHALTGVESDAKALSRCVVVSAEQPQSFFFDGNLQLAAHAGAVLDINRRAVRSYEAAGIAAEHLRLGYSEAWDRRPQVPERDIDILFAGRASIRRERALAEYADLLEPFNCHILLSDDSTPNSVGSPNFVGGDEKLWLLARSKVLLNLHGEDEPYFEWLRVAEAISAGCAVVSEHSTDVEPLRAGIDFLSGRLESLGALAAYLAEDGEKRTQVASAAEKQLRGRGSLAEGARTLLSAAERIDSAPVHPEQLANSRTFSIRVEQSNPQFDPAVFDDGVTEGEHRILRALKRSHLEMLTLRRRLSRAELARQRPERPSPELVDVGASPGWDRSPRPRVTVVVPLFNDGEVVLEALDSVEQSTYRSWEIVVVDDASENDSGRLVLDWMADHSERRCRLVRHEINAGLSRARNTGARLARGELLLMLDADNRMRRLGLERLVEALDRDRGAAFAYGFLDKFVDGESVGLVSRFAWEPERFRQGNFIDALALVRRSTLARFGGYSEDSRLALGLEDYDLWARCAEAGERGVFVRNFVASYRAGYSSMVSVTSVSFADARAAIAEHAPTLMRGVEIV